MKKQMLFIWAFLYAVLSSYGQETSYGLKAGINSAMGGQITGISSGVGYTSDTFKANSKLGFHIGAFFQLNLDGFFVRPELEYHSLKTEFKFPLNPSAFEVQKINVPVLVGFNIQESFSVYLGPAYSHILSATLQGKEFTEAEPLPIHGEEVAVQTIPINFQLGMKYEYKNYGIDLRYEHNLSSAETEYIDINHNAPAWHGINRATFDDSRLSQFIVSFTYKIGGSESGRRRNRWGYRR